ncbi:MAG: hypothetical protein JXB24_08350 [Bacteroidales bacterium]|nr:hypothetical protein [Bacteroidales bacterium]
MKNKSKNWIPILGMLTLYLLLSGCSKEEEDVFEQGFDGLLEVEYVNTFPDWITSDEMITSISKSGEVLIEAGSLNYSGEYIMDDTKITRSGSWQLKPSGHITTEGGITYVVVNPNISVLNDITTIYTKDNSDNWVKVSEAPFSGDVGGNVTFAFDAATVDPNGSITGVNDGTGSIIWTLTLYPSTVPI